mmetsp:Transcript_33795/g.84808  ORF Transcript_33795/g.84808 Transcript_33795/m.84808 type:complete len:301 (+) Transcript_33795:122-1024(+)
MCSAASALITLRGQSPHESRAMVTPGGFLESGPFENVLGARRSGGVLLLAATTLLRLGHLVLNHLRLLAHQPLDSAVVEVNVGLGAAGQERMQQRLLGGETLRGIEHEQPLDKVLGAATHLIPLFGGHAVVGCHDHLEELADVIAGEGRIAREQNVGDHTHRPHVHRLAIWFFLQDLGSHIAGRSAGGLQLHHIVKDLGQTEIGQLQVQLVLLFEEDVLRFDVTVHDVDVVQVVHGLADLTHRLLRVGLCEGATCYDVVEEFTTACILHHQIELVGGLANCLERDDMRMANLAKNVRLQF